MSAATRFLTLEQVLAVHQRMIRDFGGEGGLRDLGLLEAAVAMPAAQVARRYLHPSLAAMAAAYLFHLCRNHPFVDGNKRTAVAAAEVFLLVNGCELAASDAELVDLTLGVADGTVSKQETVRFFQRHVKA